MLASSLVMFASVGVSHPFPPEIIAYAVWAYFGFSMSLRDILVQSRRDERAADQFFRKLFKAFGEPRVVVADKLRSYAAALKDLAPGIKHRSHKGLDNRSEGSHRPIRRVLSISS